MKNKKFPFKLQQEDAIKIINSACTTSWKEKLIDIWCHEIFINGIVEINEQFYKEMRCDCNETQHKLFDDIFGKDEHIIKYKIGDIIMTLDKANENPIGNENDDKGGKGFIPSTLLKIVKINDYDNYQVLFFYNQMHGIYSNSVRPAIEEEIKNYCPYKKDELILVRDFNNSDWILRYSTGKSLGGKVECYNNQLKSEDATYTTKWHYHKSCTQNLLD